MNYFNQTFPNEFRTKPQEALKRHDRKTDERWFVANPKKSYDFWRDHLNGVLEAAYRHKAIDNDVLNRLRNLDQSDATFFQSMQELRFACFAEKLLDKDIQFYPAGQNNKKLDL